MKRNISIRTQQTESIEGKGLVGYLRKSIKDLIAAKEARKKLPLHVAGIKNKVGQLRSHKIIREYKKIPAKKESTSRIVLPLKNNFEFSYSTEDDEYSIRYSRYF